MFNSGILDVVLGLTFVFLLLSLVCTAVNEWIEAFLKKRSATLEQGLREMLNDPEGTGLACDVYTHPLIYSLYRGEYDPKGNKKLLPSYIPAKNFAIALTDIVLSKNRAEDGSALPIEAAISKLENPKVRGALLSLTQQAEGNLNKTRKNIEEWYDSGMDRVSGWYKRHVQRVTLTVAFLIAIALNVDTIHIATRLSYDVAMRDSLVAAVQSYANSSASSATGMSMPAQTDYAPTAQSQDSCTTPECKVSENLNQVAKFGLLGLPIGWNANDLKSPPVDWLTRVIGWILTAFAVSLGAPFWFDMLNRIMVVRSTVNPKEKSPDEPPVNG